MDVNDFETKMWFKKVHQQLICFGIGFVLIAIAVIYLFILSIRGM